MLKSQSFKSKVMYIKMYINEKWISTYENYFFDGNNGLSTYLLFLARFFRGGGCTSFIHSLPPRYKTSRVLNLSWQGLCGRLLNQYELWTLQEIAANAEAGKTIGSERGN